MKQIKARKYGAVYERIREWMLYNGDVRRPSAPKLGEEDRKAYERLLVLRGLYFQKAHSYHDAMRVMMKTEGISEPTFNRLHHGLIYVFGDLEEESREFERQRLKEMAMKTYQLAASKQDTKGMAGALQILVKLGGFDRDEADKVPLELLNPGVYVLGISDEDRQMIRISLMAGGGVVDLDKMYKEANMIEDVEHEDITPKAAGQ